MKLAFSLTLVLGLVIAPLLSHANTQDIAKIALHLQPKAPGTVTVCGTSAPTGVPCSQFDIAGRTGISYDAYIIAANLNVEAGLSGMSFGVGYDENLGVGVDVFGWTLCAELDFTHGNWPASGSGTRLTWLATTDCQRGVVPGWEEEGAQAIAGALYVYAYSPDILSVTHNYVDTGPEIDLADCAVMVSSLGEEARGALRFSEDESVLGYNPCTQEGTPPPLFEPPNPPPPPPPPPPPTEAQEAAVFLHVGPVTGRGDEGCATGPTTAQEVVTALYLDQEEEYLVYLLGSPKSPDEDYGLGGVQFGIEYGDGLTVLDWYSCSSSEFTTPEWPSTGSGATCVWITDECERTEIVVAGLFRVSASQPTTMSIIGHPNNGQVTVASCGASATVLDHVVPDARLGWLSLGSTLFPEGCNPLVTSCEEAVPVEVVTWSRVKALYTPGN